MVIAIDIGGTKTLIAAFDVHGRIIHEERFLTPRNPQKFLQILLTKLKAWQLGTIQEIIVAAAGLIDTTKGNIIFSPKLAWKDIPIKKILADHYDCPIYVENDANAASLGAVHALKHIPPLALYVTIGTSIGTGIIVNGRIDHIISRAEGGHMVLEHHGLLQTWERFASGRAIKKQFGQLAADITSPSTWHEIADNIAAGLCVLVPTLRPDVILIGGGVGSHFDQFSGPLIKLIDERLPAFIARPQVLQALDPEKAVIYGCYQYATIKKSV